MHEGLPRHVGRVPGVRGRDDAGRAPHVDPRRRWRGANRVATSTATSASTTRPTPSAPSPTAASPSPCADRPTSSRTDPRSPAARKLISRSARRSRLRWRGRPSCAGVADRSDSRPCPSPSRLIAPTSGTLLDLLHQSRVRDVIAVVGFALFTALAAQISIPLGFTPVPITGQTFAVLLAGGVLGANRGALSMGLYVALGAIGLPFYADGDGGWSVATGATAGYLVGFIVAAFVVGKMAEHGQDRKLSTSLPAFVAGSLIIYGFGATWLAIRPRAAADRRRRRAERDLARRGAVPRRRHHQGAARRRRCCPQPGSSPKTAGSRSRRLDRPRRRRRLGRRRASANSVTPPCHSGRHGHRTF